MQGNILYEVAKCIRPQFNLNTICFPLALYLLQNNFLKVWLRLEWGKMSLSLSRQYSYCRQTWEANATVASETQRNKVLMVLRVGARNGLGSLNASDGLSLLTLDAAIRQFPQIPSTIFSALTFRWKTNQPEEISLQCEKRPEGKIC